MELNGIKLNTPSFFWRACIIRQIKHHVQITEGADQAQTFSSYVHKSCPKAANGSISESHFLEVSKLAVKYT